ncbi:MAG: hypothetical protein R8K46_03275 [Mariprofundaceae bacterium]
MNRPGLAQTLEVFVVGQCFIDETLRLGQREPSGGLRVIVRLAVEFIDVPSRCCALGSPRLAIGLVSFAALAKLPWLKPASAISKWLAWLGVPMKETCRNALR